VAEDTGAAGIRFMLSELCERRPRLDDVELDGANRNGNMQSTYVGCRRHDAGKRSS
jgi:hypothetical protein